MFIQEELFNKVEKVEREIWYLIKNKLPALKDEILALIGQGSGNKDLLEKITANTNNITKILADLEEVNALITSINSSLTEQEEKIATLNTTVQNNEKDITNLNKTVNENTTAISSNATQITAVKQDLTTLSTQVDNNKQQIQANATQISANSQQIGSNKEEFDKTKAVVDSLVTNFSSTIGRLNELNNRVADIYLEVQSNTESISGMADDVADVQSSMIKTSVNVSNLTNKVAANSTEVQTLSTQVGQNTSKLGTVEGNINTTNQKVSAVESRVEALEKGSGGGGGRVVEVIYDMNSTDAAINQGFTAGMKTNNAVYWQNDNYDFIRVYASLNGNAGYCEMPLKNILRDDFMVTGVNATGKAMNHMRGFVFKSQKRINAGLRFTYTVGSDGNITFDSSSNDKFFFSRIEGVIGV